MFESKVHGTHDAAAHASLSVCPKPGSVARKARSLPDDCFRAIAASTGLDWLLAAQACSDAYFHLARTDCVRLGRLVDDWPAHGHAVRNLLAAKLRRALVRDPDRMPYDVVTMGARVEFCMNSGDPETCFLVHPDGHPVLEDGVPVTSAIGALLLGLTERHTLRQHAPDGSAFTLRVKKVRQFRGGPQGVFYS